MKRRILLLLCFLPALASADLPLIQSHVGPPVVPELMGGCSLRCAFPWETFAILPGKSPIPVYTLDDNDEFTAWTDGVVGATLTFHFPAKLPKELNDMPFYGFDIADGMVSSDSDFKQWGRVKKVRLFYNGKPFAEVQFANTRHWQNISFDDIMADQGDVFSMQILEVTPGTRHATAAITELILQGAH
ncbi:MAG: hypothetical protein ABSE62_07490 [Chthoniobacteraceae bacterium]|jgi:hypothetical protein